KCQEAENVCMICKPPWSNPDTFSKFRETSEKYRLSSRQKAISPSTTITNNLGVNGIGFSSRAQYASNV
ncbi:2997_t:CDS:2, partial [Gigaspora rosea]